MADLRESGQIEQDSDAVILLHPESEDAGGGLMVPTFKMELIVDKNRHGRTGSVHLNQEYEHADLT